MTRLFEDVSLRSKKRIFKDRAEAGRRLVPYLKDYIDQDTIVLAIPSGGVPVGIELAKALSVSFDMIIVRKIPIPGNPEAGFGAITLEGDVFLNEPLIHRVRLSSSEIETAKERVRTQIESRNRIFRQNRPPAAVQNRNVILTDDGLASGYTMMASISSVNRAGARKIIVAVPTAPRHTLRRITGLVGDIVCLNVREESYFAVADAYKQWMDLSEDDVLDYFEKSSCLSDAVAVSTAKEEESVEHEH